MSFLKSGSASAPESPTFQAWWLPFGLAVLFWVLFALNIAESATPDGAAYIELSQLNVSQWMHSQHLLYGVPLGLLLWALPGQDPTLVAGHLSALFGGVGVGTFTFFVQRLGYRPTLSAAVASTYGLSFGWWSLSTAWEVHVLAVGMVFFAAGLALSERARPLLLGAVLALAVLLHKTMALALPAVLLSAALGRKDWLALTLKSAGALCLAVLLGYAGALATVLHYTSHQVLDAVDQLLLGELREGGVVPQRDRPFARAGEAISRALVRPSTARGQRYSLWISWLGPALGLLSAAGSAAQARALGPGARGPALALWLWPALALPVVLAFEPSNFEYYLGPLGLALAMSAGLFLHRVASVLAPLIPLALGTWNLVGPGVEVGLDQPHPEQQRPARREGPARTPADR